MKFPDHISTTRYICIVRNHHNRVFGFFMECIDDIHNPRGIPFIEVSCWLIRKEKRYICNKCSCDSNPLLFSSWELRRIPLSLPCESYFFENLTRRISSWSMRNIKNQIDILFDGQIRYELKCLKYECNMLPSILDHRISRKCYDICIIECDITKIRREYSCNQRKKCRLASSTCPHQCHETSPINMPIQIRKKYYCFSMRSVWFWDIFECNHKYFYFENNSREERLYEFWRENKE